MIGTPLIFLSYRRDDSADITGRIFDGLVACFGEAAIFRDIDTIPLGVDFRTYIDQMVGQCGILLAMIGPDWLTIKNEAGNRRLDDPRDFVRIEIETALAREIPVIPLLVREARMPQESELPENLKDLAFRNAIPIRRDPDFHHDIVRLIAGLEELLPELKKFHQTKNAPSDRERRNELVLLSKVRTFWVEGVLERSLHEAVLHDLEIREEKEAIDKPHPWEMVLDLPERPGEKALPPSTRLIEIFDDLEAEGNRTMLILGEPGSGKTISLLELARDTVSRAEKVSGEPIPVVFNLSAWGEKRQPLADWLIEELNQKYQIPKQIGRNWVEKQALLLLLDGLDEVRADIRTDCVKTINTFQQENGLTPIVVCSRIQEYEALQKRLQFQRAVRLLSLSAQQVDDYLLAVGEPLASLRIALEQDETLRELARSPLMLNIMSLAYRDIPAESLLSAELQPVEARRRHMFGAYVRRMFRRRGAKDRYTPEETVHWLNWIAQNMAGHSQSVFLLENLQPSWITTPIWRWFYFILTRVLASTCVIVVCWFVLLTIDGSGIRNLLLSGPIIASITGLILASIDAFRLRNMGSVNNQGENRRTFWRKLLYLLVVGLIGGMVVGWFMAVSLGVDFVFVVIFSLLFGGIPYILVIGLRGRWQALWADIRTIESLNYNWRRLGWVVTLGVVLPGVLIFTITQYLYLQGYRNLVLWDVETDNRVWSQNIGTDVKKLAFNPDGTRILATGWGIAGILDGQSGALITVIEPLLADSTAVFSPDGSRILAFGCDDWNVGGFCDVSTAQLWDAQSGEQLHQDIKGYSWQNKAVFSPDGRRILITGCDDDQWDDTVYSCLGSTIRVWDTRSNTLLLTMDEQKSIKTAVFSPDGSRILTAGCDDRNIDGLCTASSAWLWDGQSGMLLKRMEGGNDIAEAVFSPDGSRILTVGWDIAWIWDGQNGARVKELEQQNCSIHTAVFSPDSTRILSANWSTACLWDAQNGTLLKVVEEPDDIPTAIFSPDGSRILTAGSGVIRLWDGQSGKLLKVMEGHNRINTAVFNPTGTQILTGADSNIDLRPLTLLVIPVLLFGILVNFQTKIIEAKSKPNQGIHLTFRNAFLVATVLGILVFVLVPVTGFVINFVVNGNAQTNPETNFSENIRTAIEKSFAVENVVPAAFIAGLFAWLIFLGYGGLDVIYHYSLRFLLILQHCTPRRYAHFLDYAADRIFLQKVGGGYYIFIHRLLLEYFASLDEEEMGQLAE